MVMVVSHNRWLCNVGLQYCNTRTGYRYTVWYAGSSADMVYVRYGYGIVIFRYNHLAIIGYKLMVIYTTLTLIIMRS